MQEKRNNKMFKAVFKTKLTRNIRTNVFEQNVDKYNDNMKGINILLLMIFLSHDRPLA